MFQNSQDEQQPCVMCGQHNQQMLMLSCVHDPCINCAATHYVENEPHNSAIYTCAKCGQETELDQSSVSELQKIYNQLKAKKKYDYRKNINSSANSQKERVVEDRPNKQRPSDSIQQSRARQGRNDIRTKERQYEPTPQTSYYAPPISQPSYSSNPKKNSYLPTYPCIDHPDEQLTYFCFSCNKPICPQCAIHGFHKDHEVQTTRKAIKQIKLLLGEDKQKLQSAVGGLVSNKEKGKKLVKEYGEENRRDLEYIKKKLGQLRNTLNQKQKQLLKSADVQLQRNSQLIKMESASSDRALQQIALCRKNIDLTLKKQDLVVLQQFNRRDEQASLALQRLQIDREKHYEYIAKNPQRVIDFHQFQQDLDRLMEDLHKLKLATTIAKQ